MAQQAVLTGSIQVIPNEQNNAKDLSGAAKFLQNTSGAVLPQLASTIELATFRQTPRNLSREDRLRLVEQALVLLEENYVNLPLKRAMHAVNPVQQLRLLQNALRGANDATLPPESDFHRAMIEIFMSVRDLHTNYILPSPYNRLTAFLPFLIEPFYEGGRRRYLVSHVTNGFSQPPFAKGVEVLSWNGVPIDRAVETNGNRYAGSNREARHARGVSTLTVRPLVINLPPDEDWVTITYLTDGGQQNELRTKWLIFSPSGDASPIPVRPDDAQMGYDVESEAVAEAKRLLFAPQVIDAEREAATAAEGLASVGDSNLPTSLPSIFEARTVTTLSGAFGYIRIRSFGEPPSVFVPEFIRLMQKLPDEGLILDVRGNGGGIITSGEELLQLFTPRTIEPEPVQFINSSVNLRLCERHSPSKMPGWGHFNLSPYLQSMRDALRTGSQFSSGASIASPVDANARGQHYCGPVVLITDALCFSTTDIFAAGFQDHEIGQILGVHGNTGAGGANVWGHDLLKKFFESPDVAPDNPYKPLPGDARLRVAIRRTLRVGKRAGTPVEDLGVTPDVTHDFTRNDLLSSNKDLIEHAGQLLKSQPKRRLNVVVGPHSPPQLSFAISTKGIDRLDIYGNGRPEGSIDVTDGQTNIKVPDRGFSQYEFRGYSAGALVASRRVAK